jgi:hypothetical protein
MPGDLTHGDLFSRAAFSNWRQWQTASVDASILHEADSRPRGSRHRAMG